MDNVYRMIDANINRVSEGLRVLEDISRFACSEINITADIRNLRHTVRKLVKDLSTQLLQGRNAIDDVGLGISQGSKLDDKTELRQLVEGNFKRVQEGLRVIEESLKIVGYYDLSKRYENLRYNIYTLEKNYNNQLIKSFRQSKLAGDIYCLTAEEHSLGRSNIEVVKAMLDAGITIIQYREKDKKMRYKYEECLKIRELTTAANATFIINDDIELAKLVAADGIHIGQEDLPLDKVRQLVGSEMIIGLSTHSPMQAESAVSQGADYIGVGPIFKTNTKKDVCDPVGLEYLDYVVNNISIPFVAIGGIKESNIAQVAKHGAKCIALVTEIVGAQDIGKKINNIRKIIAEENK